MRVKVKMPFFDNNGLHKKGDIVEVDKFESDRMELVEEKVEKKTVLKKKEVKNVK